MIGPGSPGAACGGAVLVHPASATAAVTARQPMHGGGSAGHAELLLGVASADGRRCGAALGAQEQREHDGDVGDPDDRLEHGGLRGEVEDALEQGAVPGVRRDRGADVEGERVEAGQDRGLLQVVHAVGEDARGHEDQQHAGDREELAEVELHAPR